MLKRVLDWEIFHMAARDRRSSSHRSKNQSVEIETQDDLQKTIPKTNLRDGFKLVANPINFCNRLIKMVTE